MGYIDSHYEDEKQVNRPALSMSEKPKPKPVKGTTRLSTATDLDAVVESASKGGWRSISAEAISCITTMPGVYLFAPPEDDRNGRGCLTLYGRTFGAKGKRRQLQIQFTYSAHRLEGTSQVILYAGKAANLRDRLKNHLKLREESTTSQMLQGLVSQALHHGEQPGFDWKPGLALSGCVTGSAVAYPQSQTA